MLKKWRYFLLIAVIALAACSKNQDDIDLPIYDSVGGNFILPSTLGTALNLADYKGKVVLINFGYTNCPDICPMILSRLAKITTKLDTTYGVKQEQLQTIFITVDPERDSIALLKEYLDFFNSNFIGISATTEQISELTKRYAVFVEKQKDDNLGYQVAHTDKIFLLDRLGRLRALYSKNDSDDQIIQDIVSLSSAEM